MTVEEKLAQVLAIVRNPVKDSVNPHFKNNYASLNECIGVVDEAIEKVGGCSYRQESAYNPESGCYEIHTVFFVGGEWMLLSSFPFINDPNPQKVASASTYARRYSLVIAFNLAAEDDDGNMASEHHADTYRNPGNDVLKVAYRRMGEAIQEWCARQGDDSPERVERAKEGVRKRPDWEANKMSLEYIEQITQEFRDA